MPFRPCQSHPYHWSLQAALKIAKGLGMNETYSDLRLFEVVVEVGKREEV